jgi:hypothetical protein
MIDKRFWGIAIAAVTVIVAGASALPSLLRRPAEPELAAVMAPVAKIAEPVPVRGESGPVARVEPKPVTAQVEQRGAEQPAAPPAPQAAAMVPAPEPVKLPAPEPPVAPPSPAPVAFPPVQPVGVATASGLDVAAPAGAPPRSGSVPRPSAEKPTRPERAAQRPAKPRRTVRPAIFPLGEFLAWRR